MTGLIPGTRAAIAALAATQAARWVAVQRATWDEQMLDAIAANAPPGSLINASIDTLEVAVWVAGELAQSLQTLGYLGRAARNLTP